MQIKGLYKVGVQVLRIVYSSETLELDIFSMYGTVQVHLNFGVSHIYIYFGIYIYTDLMFLVELCPEAVAWTFLIIYVYTFVYIFILI